MVKVLIVAVRILVKGLGGDRDSPKGCTGRYTASVRGGDGEGVGCWIGRGIVVGVIRMVAGAEGADATSVADMSLVTRMRMRLRIEMVIKLMRGGNLGHHCV